MCGAQVDLAVPDKFDHLRFFPLLPLRVRMMVLPRLFPKGSTGDSGTPLGPCKGFQRGSCPEQPVPDARVRARRAARQENVPVAMALSSQELLVLPDHIEKSPAPGNVRAGPANCSSLHLHSNAAFKQAIFQGQGISGGS